MRLMLAAAEQAGMPLALADGPDRMETLVERGQAKSTSPVS
jgi:hypothetical protein